MISIDYSYSSINVCDLKKYEKKIKNIVSLFKNKECIGNDYIGWYEYPLMVKNEIKKIVEVVKEIKNKSQVFVVCGIGGSYLGSRAVIEAVKGFYNSDVEIVYLGNTFDEKYIKDTLNYLKDKEFSVNVISKSGGTLETSLAFRLLKELLVDKYGDRANERIYVTTDEHNGSLRKMVKEYNYCSFVIPANVGGRYSVFTPVGLLPLAVAGVDIEKFVDGAIESYNDFQNDSLENNIAYQYAAYRYLQYSKKKKNVEVMATYSVYLNMFSEWWKQLFGESEGKDSKGLFPASVNFSTDLHSLGQYVQDGSKCLFITQLRIEDEGTLFVKKDESDMDGLNYLEKISVQKINQVAQIGTNKAHYCDGKVDNLNLVMKNVDDKSVGYLLYFMMCSCMISGFLLKVNPFDQPGVELYKKEMKKILKSF